MDQFTLDDLKQLAEPRWGPCVSIYVPTYRSAPDSQRGPVHLKNLLRLGLERLMSHGVRRSVANSWLQPAEDRLLDGWFWTHQGDGLAIFATADEYREFRLPVRFEEQALVDRDFQILPLIPLTHPEGTFYVLAISQNLCRLLRGTRFTLEELHAPQLPSDLRSELGWYRERQLNLHSMRPGPVSRPGSATTVYHGHEQDTRQIDLSAYLRRVNAALHPLLATSTVPLVFAGVADTFAIYRDVTQYRRLADRPVAGNPDALTNTDLHRAAWPIVEPMLSRQEHRVTKEFGAAREAGRATINTVQVVTAACDGLVETLLVRRDAELPGDIDASEGNIVMSEEPHSGGRNLANVAAVHTLRAGGTVLSLESDLMPPDCTLAAVLRAPVSAVPPRWKKSPAGTQSPVAHTV